MEALREALPLEFITVDKIGSKVQGPVAAPTKGLIEFWAPVLVSDVSCLHWKENVFKLTIPGIQAPQLSRGPQAGTGMFRVDHPGEETEIHELVAIMVSPCTVSVIGLVRKDKRTFTRIGIVSIFYPYHVDAMIGDIFSSKIENFPVWKIRLIRMR
jgi:hypothetical protein